MSKTLIETYRGWEIYFDTNSEDFYTTSNEYDKDAKKRSYASTKKFIDDYIKENNEFKPIKVQSMETSYKSSSVITLIGIRKDGAFIFQDEKGNKKQLSSYDESDFFLVNQNNEGYFNEIEKLENEIKSLREKIKEAESKIVKVDVKQIRRNLLGQ
jgi:hypothetical protein